ncbi:hypothetical protein KKG83_07640 [Candidatus Micrarchaeota archaeon]|nr:hypothetical protein [Candidatus Micrarchaeota archaeon]MBU2477313.1 hypothetical protein [Candidatus Micrarchaeota archaeon]
MSDKLKNYLGFGIVVAVIVSVLLWFSFAESNLISLPFFGILATIIIIAIWALKRKMDSVKSGVPVEDELSKKLMHKAGYYVFLASIYVTLFIGVFEENIAEFFGFPMLEVHHVTAMIVLFLAISFMASYFYLSIKGNVE